eukprot:TRINITY_DN3303_c0_g1_i1.p1 TRINITY_DN3303_c0_g1~~TRINITY_DN3303_c0_g1_i1.p1  ORF type:complete len:1323 (-),score=214.64 TRINITY_DN3303_c0_g1_i1:14-3982(-)
MEFIKKITRKDKKKERLESERRASNAGTVGGVLERRDSRGDQHPLRERSGTGGGAAEPLQHPRGDEGRGEPLEPLTQNRDGPIDPPSHTRDPTLLKGSGGALRASAMTPDLGRKSGKDNERGDKEEKSAKRDREKRVEKRKGEMMVVGKLKRLPEPDDPDNTYEPEDEREGALSYEWRIEDFWSYTDVTKLKSKCFKLPSDPGCEWNFLLFPKGVQKTNHISLYLNSSALKKPKQLVYALSVYNQDPRKTIKRTATHIFAMSQGDQDWGWNHFMQLQDTRNIPGYLFNEALVARVDIHYGGPDGPSSLVPKSLNSSKIDTGYPGLNHFGAGADTQALNSIIQSFFYLYPVKKALFRIDGTAPPTSIPLQLQKIFFGLQSGSRRVEIDQLVAAVKHSTQWGNRGGPFQETDSPQLIRLIVAALDNALPPPYDGLISSMFEGSMYHHIKCNYVDYSSERTDPFYDILLNVEGYRDIYEALDAYFSVEVLSGINMYRTPVDGLQEATKWTKIDRLPNVLQVTLNRFTPDPATGTLKKIRGDFLYPSKLCLDKYMHDDSKGESANYTLYAVFLHKGDTGKGSYCAFIRPSPSPLWYLFNNDKVFKATRRSALGRTRYYKEHPTTVAYLLLYLRDGVEMQRVPRDEPKDLIPASLYLRLQKEEGQREKMRKMQAELHLYEDIRIYCSKTLMEWQGMDLASHNGYTRIVDKSPLASFSPFFPCIPPCQVPTLKEIVARQLIRKLAKQANNRQAQLLRQHSTQTSATQTSDDDDKSSGGSGDAGNVHDAQKIKEKGKEAADNENTDLVSDLENSDGLSNINTFANLIAPLPTKTTTTITTEKKTASTRTLTTVTTVTTTVVTTVTTTTSHRTIMYPLRPDACTFVDVLDYGDMYSGTPMELLPLDLQSYLRERAWLPSKPLCYRLPKSMTLRQVKRVISKVLGVPDYRLRLWPLVRRRNLTIRTDTAPLSNPELTLASLIRPRARDKTIRMFVEESILPLSREREIVRELMTTSSSSSNGASNILDSNNNSIMDNDEEDGSREKERESALESQLFVTDTVYSNFVLIFFKFYNPQVREMRNVCYMLLDATTTVNSILPILRALRGFPPDTPLMVYEEIKASMIDVLACDKTLKDLELSSGDIICFEKALPPDADQRERFDTALQYYEYLRTYMRVLLSPHPDTIYGGYSGDSMSDDQSVLGSSSSNVHLAHTNSSNKPSFTLECSSQITLAAALKLIAHELHVEDRQVRLYQRHIIYSDSQQQEELSNELVQLSPTTFALLSDLVYPYNFSNEHPLTTCYLSYVVVPVSLVAASTSPTPSLSASAETSL